MLSKKNKYNKYLLKYSNEIISCTDLTISLQYLSHSYLNNFSIKILIHYIEGYKFVAVVLQIESNNIKKNA